MSKNRTPLSSGEVAAIQKLIVDTQFRLHQLMEELKVSRADLAKKLNCSKARITQLFGDHPNLTLESIARLFHALGDEARITSDRVEAIVAKIRRDVAASNRSEAWWAAFEWSSPKPRRAAFKTQELTDMVICKVQSGGKALQIIETEKSARAIALYPDPSAANTAALGAYEGAVSGSASLPLRKRMELVQ